MDWRWYKDGTPGNAWALESYWRNCHNLYDYRKVEPEKSKAENRNSLEQCVYLRKWVAVYEQGPPYQYTANPVLDDPGWFGRGQQYLSLERVN